MSENKCPCCGCPMKETYLGFVCPADNCAFRCSTNSLPRIAAAMELAKAEVAASNAVWSVPLERLEPAVEAAEDMLFRQKCASWRCSMGDVKRYEQSNTMSGVSVESENGRYVLHSDYAALLSSHNALEKEIAQRQETEDSLVKWVHDLGVECDALVEAVAWERECEDFDRWADAMRRAWSCEWDDVVHSARAEVDRLLKEEL